MNAAGAPPGRRRARRAATAVLALVLLVIGVGLRAWHVATPSLWWDELVEVRVAGRASWREVLRSVREGAAPGAGNAGAMPLDYLALHAWQRWTNWPAPEHLERHLRTPSLLFSCAALPLGWLAGAAAGGPVVAAGMLALVATSLPLLLYAAEARPYSAIVATGLLGLLAFAHLLAAPARRDRRLAFVAASALAVSAGLYAVFPFAVEAGALLVAGLVARDRRERGVVPFALGSAALLVLALLVWLGPGALGMDYGRDAASAESLPGAVRRVADFFAGGGLVLRAAMLAVPPLCLLLARGADARRRILLGALAVLPLAVPCVLWIARWQGYYLHPRHTLFLLPGLLLALALGLERVVGRLAPLGSSGARAALAAALVVAFALPTLAAFVRDPMPSFRATKTVRDFRGLAADLASRARGLSPSERLLVVAERRRAGHLANPVLAFYLGAWGVGGRTVLLGSGDPERVAPLLASLGPARCHGEAGELAVALGVGDPFDQPLPMRMLLGMPLRPLPKGPVCGVVLVTWSSSADAAGPARRNSPPTTRVSGDGWEVRAR